MYYQKNCFEAISNWEFEKDKGLDKLSKEYATKLRLIPISTIQKEKTWVIGIKYEEWIVNESAFTKRIYCHDKSER